MKKASLQGTDGFGIARDNCASIQEMFFKITKTTNFRGDPTDVSAEKETLVSTAVLPISKLNKLFFGYFDPENIFLDNKNK